MKKHSFILTEKQWIVILKVLDMAHDAISWNIERSFDSMPEDEHHELCTISQDIREVISSVSNQGIVAMMESEVASEYSNTDNEKIIQFKIRNLKNKSRPL